MDIDSARPRYVATSKAKSPPPVAAASKKTAALKRNRELEEREARSSMTRSPTLRACSLRVAARSHPLNAGCLCGVVCSANKRHKPEPVAAPSSPATATPPPPAYVAGTGCARGWPQ
jgi:hypothetical protein